VNHPIRDSRRPKIAKQGRRVSCRENEMAILITTARFTAAGAQGGAVVAPSEHVEAAGRLIARIGGTLIGCYRTSGDHDVLIIFEAPSYEEAMAALAAAAAGSGVTDLKTVRVLALHETKTLLAESGTGAAIRPSEGMNAAQHAATAPGAQPAALPDGETSTETEADAKAAARILEARKKSAEDIAAGRPAPYYLTTPTPAPSRPNSARASKDDDGSAKR
jgi:uncharacterized protein with GYD domain